jgi:hypothetical protein
MFRKIFSTSQKIFFANFVSESHVEKIFEKNFLLWLVWTSTFFCSNSDFFRHFLLQKKFCRKIFSISPKKFFANFVSESHVEKILEKIFLLWRFWT